MISGKGKVDMPKLDIVIPVYNEGENIFKVLDAFDRCVHTESRVLICYDQDSDNTLEVIHKRSQARIPVVCIKNRYKGALGAVLTGFECGDSPAALVYPADDTVNAPIIDGMFAKFEEGADIVAASRFMKGGCMKGCPIVKATLVRTAAFLLYHIGRLPTHDPTNGFRLFSRRLLNQVKIESPAGFAFSIELLVKCHRMGGKVAEMPSRWIERQAGKSRFKVFKWMPVYLKWFFYAFGTTYLGLHSGRRPVVKH